MHYDKWLFHLLIITWMKFHTFGNVETHHRLFWLHNTSAVLLFNFLGSSPEGCCNVILFLANVNMQVPPLLLRNLAFYRVLILWIYCSFNIEQIAKIYHHYFGIILWEINVDLIFRYSHFSHINEETLFKSTYMNIF